MKVKNPAAPARSVSVHMRRPALILRSAILKLPARAPIANRWAVPFSFRSALALGQRPQGRAADSLLFSSPSVC
jgi:hypothetical protein